jgi:HEAT repeat protein
VTLGILAADALGAIGGAPAVLPLLGSTERHARWNAARELGFLKDPRAVERLLARVTDGAENANVIGEAIHALGEIGDRRAVEPLVQVLRTRSWGSGLPEVTARALGKLDDPRAVDVLLWVLREKKELYVRFEAANALGEIGDPRAIEPLIAYLERVRLPGQKTAAAGALEKLTGQSFGKDARAWREWWQKQGR